MNAVTVQQLRTSISFVLGLLCDLSYSLLSCSYSMSYSFQVLVPLL